jgi:ketosteroid isomerase-like protein
MQPMKSILTVAALLIGTSLAFLRLSLAQQAPHVATTSVDQLRNTITSMDHKLFDAFNAHNADALMGLFTDDVEFFQDNDGLKDYQRCFRDFKALFASNTDIRREIVPESLEVYPIKDYGAIEIGTHRFCHKENGHIECAAFKFVMIWRQIGESWKVSRVVSYGHKLRP